MRENIKKIVSTIMIVSLILVPTIPNFSNTTTNENTNVNNENAAIFDNNLFELNNIETTESTEEQTTESTEEQTTESTEEQTTESTEEQTTESTEEQTTESTEEQTTESTEESSNETEKNKNTISTNSEIVEKEVCDEMNETSLLNTSLFGSTITGTWGTMNLYYDNTNKRLTIEPKQDNATTTGNLKNAIVNAGINISEIKMILIKSQSDYGETGVYFDGSDESIFKSNTGVNDFTSLEEVSIGNFYYHADFSSSLNPNTTKSMFEGCTNLKTVNLYVSYGYCFTNISNMFKDCTNLETVNIGTSLSYVTDASSMFSGCSKLSTLTLDNFLRAGNSDVTNVSNMFNGCTNLESINFNANLENVTDASGMFKSCEKLTSLPSLTNLGNSCTNFTDCFASMKTIEDLDLSGVKFNSITNDANIKMFDGNLNSLKSITLGKNGFGFIAGSSKNDLRTTTQVGSLFSKDLAWYYSSSGTNIDNQYKTTDEMIQSTYNMATAKKYNIINKIKVIASPSKLEYKNEESFNPNGLKIKINDDDNLTCTYSGNETLFPYSPLKVSRTTPSVVFKYQNNETYKFTIDTAILSYWGGVVLAHNRTNKTLTMKGSTNVTSGTLKTSLETENIITTDIEKIIFEKDAASNKVKIGSDCGEGLFSNIGTSNKFSALKEVDFTNSDFSSVTSFKNMFALCDKITSIDLSSINHTVTNCDNLFAGCTNLKTVNIANINTNGGSMTNMFATSSNAGLGGTFDAPKITSLTLGANTLKGVSNVEDLKLNDCQWKGSDNTTYNTTKEMLEDHKNNKSSIITYTVYNPTPPKPTPTPTPPTGGGSSSSGGSGGGSGYIPSIKIENQINNNETEQIKTSLNKEANINHTNINRNESTSHEININNISWERDSTTNKWKLKDIQTNQNATAGYYTIVGKDNPQYFFDEQGYMHTGWLTSNDNKTYFFQIIKNDDEGKMFTGWNCIDDNWYYFDQNGKLILETGKVTPNI